MKFDCSRFIADGKIVVGIISFPVSGLLFW